MLDFITWTADPAIFSIGSREICLLYTSDAADD